MTRRNTIAAFLIGAVLAASAALLLPRSEEVSATEAYSAPGLDPLSVSDAQTEFWRLTPALLLVVYEAFGQTEENAIYDTLAGVTHGEALEYLYLERVGAMKGGGLEEVDQQIHEIKLLNSQAKRVKNGLAIDATWQVIGTVGHSEHLHVRGNTYSANLSVAPVEGAWRITEFELLSVDRDTAGETFADPQTN